MTFGQTYKLRVPAIAALTLASAVCITSARAGTGILFNPAGGGATGAYAIGSLDWLPGNAVIGTVPIPEDAISLNQVYGHAALATGVDADGKAVIFPDLGTAYEITFYGSNGVEATQFQAADNEEVTFVLENIVSTTNFFEMKHDTNVDSDMLAGTGFSNGQTILSGPIVQVSGNYSSSPDEPDTLDKSPDGNQWGDTLSVVGRGSQNIRILVTFVDKDFFPEGVDIGTILAFNNSQLTPFNQTNPSMSFNSDDLPTSTTTVVGSVNGLTGPNMLLQTDPNNSFDYLPPAQACRVTGGGNDTSGIGRFEDGATYYDGTEASGGEFTPAVLEEQCKGGRNGDKNCVIVEVSPEVIWDWSMGGQAGANTAKQPQPKGEWEHNNHEGAGGLQFAFHGGTSSAAPGTEIDEIICTDEGWCQQARPAPSKQIDFVGIGEFSNFQVDDEVALIAAANDVNEAHVFPGIENVVAGSSGCKPNGNGPNSCARNPDTFGTLHWFQVHIEDAGEPGNKFDNGLGQGGVDEGECPVSTNGVYGHGNDPFLAPPRVDNDLNCDCADFYRITIYAGFVPEFNEDGEVTNADKENKIYEAWGYLNGGNFQIHPQTGFDLR